MNMAEVRERFPQYNDMSDGDLAQALHKKFYSDMPYDQFAAKIGLAGDPLNARSKPKEVVERVGEFLGGVPRQVGLTARAGMQGLGTAVGVASDPIAAGVNLATGSRIPFARQTATNVADFIGLPSPQTPTERVAGGAAELIAGAGGFGAAGRVASGGSNAIAQQVGLNKVLSAETARQAGRFLSADPARQVASAAGAGLAGGSVKETGGGPGAEFGAALLGSVAGGLAPGGLRTVADITRRVTAPKLSPQQIDIRIERMLTNQGIDYSAMAPAVKASLRTELGRALNAGDDLSPDAVRRLADFRTVGATPTRGSLTLDPVQITREKNLAKMAANSGRDELYGLPRIENQNNRALIDKLSEVRGREFDLSAAGERTISAVGAKDARFRTLEGALYERARASAGRDIPLDREQFVFRAYEELAKQNKGAFLPAEVDGLLRSIREGTMRLGGRDVDVPFNVDVIDNLKTTLATASRGAKDGNTRRAISIVRDALENAQPVSSPMQSMNANLPADAMRAFDRARAVARMRRTWQESAPGIKAAIDDEAPDQFVQKFVLSPSANVGDVSALAAEVKRSPAALEAIKSGIVGHLKAKALNEATDEVGKFSQSAYNKAIAGIKPKLPLFFNKEEIAQLQAVGRVASYTQVQPIGSAVNNSNSGAMLAGRALDALTGVSRYLPGGQVLLTDPIRSIQLSTGTRGAQNIAPGLLAPRPPTPVLTGSALLPAVLSAGLLSAP